MRVRLVDNQFQPNNRAGNGLIEGIQTKIEWTRDLSQPTDIIFFTDTSFNRVTEFNAKYKIAWVLESPDITPYQRNWLRQNIDLYDRVITFDEALLREFPKKCLFYLLGGTWIKKEDQKIWDKTKNTSIIASVKNWTSGHKFRHEIVNKFRNNIDMVCGNGYQKMDYKLDGLKDFRYSFIIENTNKPFYFSEKLIDSFLTGTIPIFFGTSGIEQFFDVRGIEVINTIADIDFSKYTEKNYISKMEYVKTNFELAKKYAITEDYIYDNVIVKHFWDCL
jgi:hypothetical protein